MQEEMNWESVYEEFRTIHWPERFVVIYGDGSSETLLRGAGVSLVWPGDDDARHVGGFSADIPKKHPRNQKQCGRHVFFDEVARIEDCGGGLIWPLTA